MFLSQVGRKACVMCIGWVRNLVCQVSKMLTFQVGMKACVLQQVHGIGEGACVPGDKNPVLYSEQEGWQLRKLVCQMDKKTNCVPSGQECLYARPCDTKVYVFGGQKGLCDVDRNKIACDQVDRKVCVPYRNKAGEPVDMCQADIEHFLCVLGGY